MASKNWPGPELQDDKFMGLEVQGQTFYEPLVPTVLSVFSAEVAPTLSEALGSHECLSVGSAPSPSVGLAPVVGSSIGPRSVVSPAQTTGEREQHASVWDTLWDLWVEPPVAPDSASVPHALHHMPINAGAIGSAPDAPHSSVSHNVHTHHAPPHHKT